jgi:hypothetical protein
MEQTTKGTVMTIDTRCGDDSSIFDTVTTETAIETPALDAWFDKHDVAEYLASELKHAYTKDLASLRVSRELTTEAQQATTHVPPTTVAEWVAQTRETGILEFEQLLAIASSQAPLISLATKLLEFVREYDPETLVIKRGDGKRNHPSPLCQCSECQAKFDEMGKGETQPACATCDRPNCDADATGKCPITGEETDDGYNTVGEGDHLL